MLTDIKEKAESFLKSPKPTKGANVGVLGDLAIDRFVFGDVDRISPEAPVPVLKYARSDERLGCAANVVANIAQFCKPWSIGVKFCSLLGQDAGASRMEALLQSLPAGIETFFIKDKSRPTSIKTRFLAGSQHQLLRVDEESSDPISPEIEELVCEEVSKLIKQTKVLVFQDYAKGLLTSKVSSEVMKLCRDNGVFCVVDPCKNSSADNYRLANLITPNVAEAEILLGGKTLAKGKDDQLVAEAAKAISKNLQLEHVMITRSQYGLSLFSASSGKTLHLPAIAREVYDVTGAGDTVVAVLAASLASGADLPEAALLASVAASIVVAKVGTSTVQLDELERALARI